MIELMITGMTCPHCVQAVTEALAKVPGVTRVIEVDLNSGRASVEGAVDSQALIDAVKTAGYEVQTAFG